MHTAATAQPTSSHTIGRQATVLARKRQCACCILCTESPGHPHRPLQCALHRGEVHVTPTVDTGHALLRLELRSAPRRTAATDSETKLEPQWLRARLGGRLLSPCGDVSPVAHVHPCRHRTRRPTHTLAQTRAHAHSEQTYRNYPICRLPVAARWGRRPVAARWSRRH